MNVVIERDKVNEVYEEAMEKLDEEGDTAQIFAGKDFNSAEWNELYDRGIERVSSDSWGYYTVRLIH